MGTELCTILENVKDMESPLAVGALLYSTVLCATVMMCRVQVANFICKLTLLEAVAIPPGYSNHSLVVYCTLLYSTVLYATVMMCRVHVPIS